MNGPEIKIDLTALAANWRMLADRAAPANTAGVVKADAYGTGLAQAGRALARAGCLRFYVAWAEEGVALREAIGPAQPIAVFHGPSKDNIDLIQSAGLTVVLNTLEQVQLWVGLGADRPPAVMHLDTGMNRLGLSEADWAAAAALTREAQPEHVMSHLACADEPGNAMNARQLGDFISGAELWPEAKRSLSSTGGVYLGADYHLDEVRVGIGMYGGGPVPATGTKPAPVMTVSAPILQVRDAPTGQTVGYGAEWMTEGPRRLATVGLGYGDGFSRLATNRGAGFVNGSAIPIVGRVSMDMIVFDVTGVEAGVGDRVELWGPNHWIGDQAAAMSTIDYELLCRIGGRAERIYMGES